MAVVRRRILLLAICLRVVAAAPFASAADNDNNVKETCSRTPFPDLCTKYLQPMPESKNASSHQLAHNAISIAAQVGMNASMYVATLMMKGGGDAGQQQCLMESGSRYYDAVALLVDATVAMKSYEYGNVTKWVALAKTGIDNCEYVCKGVELPSKASLDEMNDVFRRLCDVIEAIIKHLKATC